MTIWRASLGSLCTLSAKPPHRSRLQTSCWTRNQLQIGGRKTLQPFSRHDKTHRGGADILCAKRKTSTKMITETHGVRLCLWGCEASRSLQGHWWRRVVKGIGLLAQIIKAKMGKGTGQVTDGGVNLLGCRECMTEDCRRVPQFKDDE